MSLIKRENCSVHAKPFYLYLSGYKEYEIGPFEDMEEALAFLKMRDGTFLFEYKIIYNCELCKSEKKKTKKKFMHNNNVTRDHLINCKNNNL